MKRKELIQHLLKNRCVLECEGKKHTLCCIVFMMKTEDKIQIGGNRGIG